MDRNENDLQKLIEAAQKSVQDGREFRTAPLGSNFFVEKEAEEQKNEETESEWNEWGKQIGGRIDAEEKSEGKALRGVLAIAAIIFAVIILTIFYLNFSDRQKTLSQTPRLNINSITSQKNADSSPSESSDKVSGEASATTKKIAIHNGVPSAQAPSWYKPLERDRKTGKIVRRIPEPPPEPVITPSFTPVSPLGSVKPEKTVRKTSGTTGAETGEYQPAWMKEAPPPKTTPRGDPIFIQ